MTRPKLNIEGYIGPNDIWMLDWFGEDGMFSAKNMREFLENNIDATEIEIDIRSDGGYIGEAMDIHDQLMNCGKTVFITGYNVKSAAVAIFLGANNENRTLTKNAEFLIHCASIDPWMCGNLTAENMKALVAELEEYDAKIANLYVERTGQTLETIQAKMLEDKLMTAEDAKSLGFCSSILNGAQATNVKNEQRAAFITPLAAKLIQNNKSNIMTNKKQEEQLSAFDKLFQKFENLANKFNKVKNLSAKTTDGTQIFYADGTELEVGTALFSDEAMTTPLTAADYTLDTGDVLTVDDKGIVSVITTKEAENVELLKVQNELKAEKAKNVQIQKEMDALKVTAENSAKETTKAIAEFKTEFENLKTSLIGDTGKTPENKKERPKNADGTEKPMAIWEIAASKAK